MSGEGYWAWVDEDGVHIPTTVTEDDTTFDRLYGLIDQLRHDVDNLEAILLTGDILP